VQKKKQALPSRRDVWGGATSARVLNFVSHSEEETEKIGAKLALHLRAGDNVRLYGGLGAGKTCLTRGIAQCLHKGESVPVKSPCFTILNIYEGEPVIYHFDFYRIKTVRDVEELGLSDYWGEGICIVEWPKKFCISLPGRTIDVIMAIKGERKRKITASIPMGG